MNYEREIKRLLNKANETEQFCKNLAYLIKDKDSLEKEDVKRIKERLVCLGFLSRNVEVSYDLEGDKLITADPLRDVCY